jgi:methylmalonyl-CoA mutase
MSKEQLFTDFPAFDASAWEALILKELKGKAPESIAVKLEDGTVLRPFATGEKATTANEMRRGTKRMNNGWRMTTDLRKAGTNTNELLLEDLMGGADSAVLPGTGEDVAKNLNDVLLAGVDLQFVDGTPALVNWLLREAERQNVKPNELFCCAGLPLETDTSGLRSAVEAYSHFRLFNIPAADHSVQATKAAILQGKEQIERLLKQGYSIDDAAARIQFKLPLGDDLFVEIARLRAFRAIWAEVIAGFNPEHACSHNTWVQAKVRYPAAGAGYTDIIRATLQAVSAVVAGCDGLTISPPQIPEGEGLARRVVRNIHHLLKDEGFLARVADPVGGAYIVEELTRVFASAIAVRHKPQASSLRETQLVADGLKLEAEISNREEIPLKSYYTRRGHSKGWNTCASPRVLRPTCAALRQHVRHPPVDHPAVRGLQHGRSEQRILPPQPRRRADGPQRCLRSGHAPRLRQRPPARNGRRGQGRCGHQQRGGHEDPLRQHPAGQDEREHDHERRRAARSWPSSSWLRKNKALPRNCCKAPSRTTS